MATAGMTLLTIIFVLSLLISTQQPASQNPSPMADHTRPHPRITQTETEGRRVDLQSLKVARLFVSAHVNSNKPVPLIIHFHGAPWLIETHIARHLPHAALITVQLGSGSNAYRKPFEDVKLFGSMLEEASRLIGLKRGWSSITLSGFSAGYGAVREILKNSESYKLVSNVILLDGMHTSYSPEGKRLADGGAIDASGLEVFVSFARDAMEGRKMFVFTHSEIFPATYASTTECADYLLQQLNLFRRPKLLEGPIGMQQLSIVDKAGLHVRGYAGNSAPDHIDHLYAMPEWFSLLRIN